MNLKRYIDRLKTVQSVVLHVSSRMEGVSAKAAKRARSEVTSFLKLQGLQVQDWHDARAGGCTDACYKVGFRAEFGLDPVPSPDNIVERSLRHFLDPKVSPFDAPQVGPGTFEHLEGLSLERRPMRGASIQDALLPQ